MNGALRIARSGAVAGLLWAGAAVCWAANTRVTLDPVPPDVSQVGERASIAVPPDGRPVISYYDSSNSRLKFVRCGNATCSSGNTVRTLDDNGRVGAFTAIAIGRDGLPVIAYYNASNESLILGKCGNIDCSVFGANIVERVGVLGGAVSLAIGADGFPVIAYRSDAASTQGLRLAKCSNATCSTSAKLMIDSASWAGSANSIAIGADGAPVIAYSANTPFQLRMAKCHVASCSTGGSIAVVDGSTNAGQFNSVAIGADGLPVIAYYDATNLLLKVAKCAVASCATGTAYALVDTAAGKWVSMAVPADGLPVISYHDEAYRQLKVAKCSTAACSGAAALTVVDSGLIVPANLAYTGRDTSIAIGAGGFPVIAYQDRAALVLRFAACGSVSCADAHALSVAKSGTGSGAVTSAPAGISCGVTCSAGFASGSLVTLTATPGSGSVFAGWSGACSGTGGCTVTMDAEKSIEAIFVAAALPSHALTVTKGGAGSGSVTSTPAGIDCGAVCTASYPSGTAVTLTATASASSSFAGWGGVCSGTGTCTVSMDAIQAVTATFTALAPAPNSPRLANLSTRMQVLTGNDVMIGGFIVEGSASKTVVIRARGPSLAGFVPSPLANPTLRLVRSSDQATLATNDNWQLAANAADITASGFAPSEPLESAILMSLAPGAYTAIVAGASNGTGVGIVEVFEVDAVDTPLVNISTRGQVLGGNDVMIGGFVIQGDGPQTVVIRARGPSLVPFGITNALADPQLRLVRSSDQATIAANDDWMLADNAGGIAASGFAPSNDREAAILVTLQPGAYTAVVSGAGGGTGVGIIEVFAN